ncbi:MAG: acetyl-CoA hydrolase/transferase C-terminal domain-containing protein, partial [Chloroflexota bacterium]
RGVKTYVPSPGYDFGWYDPGWEESFEVTVSMVTATCQEAVDAHRVDIDTGTLFPFQELPRMRMDVLLTEVSPPDERGFCSFGASLWNKRRLVEAARVVIAEVNPNLIRTFGDNFVHVSQIDYFVEHLSSGKAPGMGTLAGRSIKEPEPYLKDIAGYVNSLLRDGDTIQIGVGRTTEPLVRLGMLEGKHDIGYHSEATPPGIIALVKEGVINGSRKTINQGKVVVTSIGGSTTEEIEWVRENPLFHLVDVEYLEDIRVIAAHDNMVAINNTLMVDITGQICSEGLGHRILAVAGGQIVFVYGAWLSRGGRSIIVMPSTAQGGQVSRIVSGLPPGTPVTLQRNLADYIVTEYGIAQLKGKTVRQRANELIAIAHPNFRGELKKAAQRLFWP